eukprot:569141-Amorphochlora_amoeboformis.AAC.3
MATPIAMYPMDTRTGDGRRGKGRRSVIIEARSRKMDNLKCHVPSAGQNFPRIYARVQPDCLSNPPETMDFEEMMTLMRLEHAPEPSPSPRELKAEPLPAKSTSEPERHPGLGSVL